MVDIHCHILPGVDDGAKNWEIAVDMCRMAGYDGIEHIVATPHANDVYAYDRDQHARTLDELREKIGGKPELTLGCDFHFSYDNIQDALAHPHRYTIGETKYLLVEFSDYSIPPMAMEGFFHLQTAGLMPIITHPERNPILQAHPEMVLDWVENGALVQVTANSLTGHWGDRAKRVARGLLERDAVHVVATDAHDLKNRPPLLSAARHALTQLRNAEVARALVEENPRAIVQGQELPYFPDLVRQP